MIQTRRIPLPPLIALALALLFLALTVSPMLADGPSGRRPTLQRPTQRSRFVLPLVRNHRRSPILRRALPTRPHQCTLPAHAAPLIDPFAPAKKTKPRLLCPGCPGDERRAAPGRMPDLVTPRIDRPGPPHPPPIIDDGRWPRPEWPSVDLRQVNPTTFPPPRDDFPARSQGRLIPLKPVRPKRAHAHK